jgi:hypothetical protein
VKRDAKYLLSSFNSLTKGETMTPNRLNAIAFRCSIFAVFTLYVFASSSQAQSAASAINGVYNGTYACAQGPRTLKLSLLASGNGSLTGLFTFYLPPNSHTQAFSYSMSGTVDARSGKFKLSPVKWEVPPRLGYSMVGMDGAFDPNTGQVTGKIASPLCGAFQATRDPAESANIDSAMAALRNPPTNHRASAQPQQPPSEPRGATKTATPLPGAPAPQSASNQPPACQLISQADAESVVGFPLRLMTPVQNSSCFFMGSRPGPIRLQVIVEVKYSATPDPDAVNRRRAVFKNSVKNEVLKPIPNVADEALWDWTNNDGGTGRLVSYKGGTTELFVTIVGISEDAALAGAERLAVRALGGAGKTGYVYTAAPSKAICEDDGHSISKCQTADVAFKDTTTRPGDPRSGSELIVRLGQARQSWANNKNGANGNFRRTLSLVDFAYLIVNILSQSGGGKGSPVLYQMLGGLPPEDTVIRAKKQFDTWVSSVYHRLPNPSIYTLGQLDQALKETETQYRDYVTVRDHAEFGIQ